MNSSETIRVALIGCGQIADAHLSQLARIPSANVVAVCDRHEDLAYQAAARFNVPQTFTDMHQMLDEVSPDVVHLTTPAQSHAPLAIELMQAGCHVYVEKPFTLDAHEAEQVMEVARECDREVSVGHDQLFDPLWLKAKVWIMNGLIGDVRHVESILGYPIDGKFGQQVAGNPNHWVRKLPGGLFQNTISHPLYRITDFMNADDEPTIIGGWLRKPKFDFPTELNITLHTPELSGQLTFSTNLPPQRITRIYGSKATMALDFDAQTLRLTKRPTLPGAFAKIEAPHSNLMNAMWNLTSNMWRFARSDIHYFAGMKTLFEQFYDSIQKQSRPPITKNEILHVTRLMDRIFDHCRDADEISVRNIDTINRELEDATCLASHA